MAIIIMMRYTLANNDQNLLELLSKQSCRLGLELLDRTVAGEAAKQVHLLKWIFSQRVSLGLSFTCLERRKPED